MKKEQFKELENFSYFNDFHPTRGNLRKMKFDTLQKLQTLRDLLPQKNNSVNFLKLKNTNSGADILETHYSGDAVDVICPMRNSLSINTFIEFALIAGFRGVGVYIDHEGSPSFHLDIREEFKLWYGAREDIEDEWEYSDLIDFNIE